MGEPITMSILKGGPTRRAYKEGLQGGPTRRAYKEGLHLLFFLTVCSVLYLAQKQFNSPENESHDSLQGSNLVIASQFRFSFKRDLHGPLLDLLWPESLSLSDHIDTLFVNICLFLTGII